MKTFLTEDFLLSTAVARELYHQYAAPQPIYDYHCHLPPAQIAANHTFRNLTEIWLAGDHYKWRAMRANGVEERYCTGDASDWEKFLAWARTVPHTLRNPLYHWTHLELWRYFGITDLLNESTAQAIWERANALLPAMPVHRLLEQSRVRVVCTTDDPTDSLEHHRAIQQQKTLSTRVYPTFRPDRVFAIDQLETWNAWLDRLGAGSSLASLLEALQQRLDFFHQHGGRLSDHGLPYVYADDCPESEAAAAYRTAREGKPVAQPDRFRSFILRWLGEQYHARGWVMQLHLGALRGTNTRIRQQLGADTGHDSIGDWPQAEALARFLDRLDQADRLPRTILYNLNPADNYVFATMIGNFQDGRIAGKIQYGSGWWFLDQKEGMEWQLNALSNLGLLSRFVGMLTDSRSFLSYIRHEYFRRVLCNLIGRDVENGELPRDIPLLGNLVARICYHNARAYFPLDVPDAPTAVHPSPTA